MSPLEPRSPTLVGPEYSNIDETQEIDLKTACVRMIEVLKEKFNKFLKQCMKTQTAGENEQHLEHTMPNFNDLLLQ